MTASFPPPAPSIGRFTAVILGFVVFVCVAMIGGTGYVKYRLDQAQTIIAAPDAALDSTGDALDRLRRDLGYGGFLGLAQNYVLAHDASGFAEMKEDIKSADDIVTHLPDKTSAETRHDLTHIVSTFDAVMQKFDAPSGEAVDVTDADLAPLYAALPVLDARVQSATDAARLAAQGKVQFWGMVLTLVSWCSLIIAAACAAGIYLALRDKHSAPMRALAQSIQNMARGDMRTAIWGIERQDMIGELARAVDIARYHFSHLPDLSLLSEQGPVRMKFEGGARSLFEAMMKSVSRDSESIRQLAVTLDEAVNRQSTSITDVTQKVESVLGDILERGQTGDVQIKKAIHDMTASAENLKNAHMHAADQLNRMLPYVQERVQGMAEIAQITGKQVAQTLQSLTLSEMGLRANADQTKETLARLSSTADDLGERMFGAINLLQAGGKVLSETTERMQGKLARGEDPDAPGIADLLQPLGEKLDQMTSRMDEIRARTADDIRDDMAELAAAIAQIHAKVEALAAAPASSPAQAAADDVTPHILSGVAQLLADKIEPQFAVLQNSLQQNLPADVRHALQEDWQKIMAQIDAARAQIEQHAERQARTVIVQTMDAASSARDGIGDIAERLAGIQTSLSAAIAENLKNQHELVAAQIDTARAQIEQHAERQARTVIVQTMDAASSARDGIGDIAERLSRLEHSLSGGLTEQVRDQWYQVTAQIESLRGNIETVLDGRVTNRLETVEQAIVAMRTAVESAQHAAENSPAPVFTLPPELQKQLGDQWYQVTAQIEATRTDIIATVARQLAALETRLPAGNGDGLAKTA
ncbi:MAG: hypothetical protein KGI37_09060, partial [Alphaproteobacteria bacterium]|nr:hypothetical protein [Alphaproteobacteria bacterium]